MLGKYKTSIRQCRKNNDLKLTIPDRMSFLIFTDRKESWTRWKLAWMFEQTFFSQLSNIPGQRAKLPRKFAHLRHTRSADTMDRMIKFPKSPFAQTNWSNWIGELREQKHDCQKMQEQNVYCVWIFCLVHKGITTKNNLVFFSDRQYENPGHWYNKIGLKSIKQEI